MSHEAFLQAVRANPDDDTPRLVYADWLDEHGDPDRAEFIRVQCEIDRLSFGGLRWLSLKEREDAILSANWRTWVDPIRDEFRLQIPDGFSRNHYFQRGFIESLWLDAEVFVTRGEELFRRVPFVGVALRRVAPWATRLAECPWLSFLNRLGFREGYVDPLDAGGVRALVGSPHISGLRRLWFTSQNIGDDGLQALIAAPWLAEVTHLSFVECGISDLGALALARLANMPALRRLSLPRNWITGSGAAELLRSPHLRRLTFLDLDGCPLTPVEERALKREFPHLFTWHRAPGAQALQPPT